MHCKMLAFMYGEMQIRSANGSVDKKRTDLCLLLTIKCVDVQEMQCHGRSSLLRFGGMLNGTDKALRRRTAENEMVVFFTIVKYDCWSEHCFFIQKPIARDCPFVFVTREWRNGCWTAFGRCACKPRRCRVRRVWEWDERSERCYCRSRTEIRLLVLVEY